MKLDIKTCLRSAAGLIAGALVVSMAYPGRSEAASPKVDVCHSEGNGSFHLITVAYQAVQAHRNHGDALPGEAVPGQSGFTFSDTCTLVAVSICPCHFSLSGLAAIGIDGDAEASRCFTDTGDFVILGQSLAEQGLIGASASGDSCASGRTGTEEFLEIFTGLTSAQVTACENDLRAASVDLGATSTCF